MYTSPNNTARIGLTYIRALSCIAIISIHIVFSAILLYKDSLNTVQLALYNCILHNLMWAVPCFIMVTGVLLLSPDKKISYQKLFRKYILKILLAILIFGLIYSTVDLFLNQTFNLQAFTNGMYKVFAGTTWSHMWYLYCLIGLYLMLPFFKMITIKSSKNDLIYLLILCIIFLSLLPLTKELGLSCGFYIYFSSIYPFWLFLGYSLDQFSFGKKKKLCLYTCLSGTLLLILFTLLKYVKHINIPENLFGYSSIFVIIQSSGLFAFMLHNNFNSSSLIGKLLIAIDQKSFGIYLIHMIFVRIFYRVFHINPFAYGLYMFIILILITLIISYILTAVLKHLPVFKRIL